MRSMLRLSSTLLVALSLAIGAIGAAAGVAQAGVAPVVAACPWQFDVNGNPVCKARACGFLGLKTCTRILHFVNGVYTPPDTCECR